MKKQIAARIKACRLKKGLTQKQLAAKVNLSRNQIWRCENNVSGTKLSTLSKIAKVLGVKVGVFLVE